MNNIFDKYIKVKEESEIEFDFSLKKEIISHKYYLFFIDFVSTMVIVLFGLFLFKSTSVQAPLGQVWAICFIVQMLFYVFHSFFCIVQIDTLSEYSDKKYNYKTLFILVGSAALAFSCLFLFQNLISEDIQSFVKNEILEMSENAFIVMSLLTAKAFFTGVFILPSFWVSLKKSLNKAKISKLTILKRKTELSNIENEILGNVDLKIELIDKYYHDARFTSLVKSSIDKQSILESLKYNKEINKDNVLETE
jgi:hypothetical protein